MNTYQIWFREVGDGRAPEVVFLNDDYKWAGEIEASTAKSLGMKIAMMDPVDSELLDHREPQCGDVLQDQNNNFQILTPSGLWSACEAFLDTEEDS